MKKVILLIVLCIGVFALASCGSNDLEGLEGIKDRGVLKVGMDLRYPPFETTDGSDNPSGISVDVASELSKYLDVDVEIVNTEFQFLIPALEANKVDIIIGSMSITDERAQKIDFSDSYFNFKMIGLVNKEFAVNNFDDINNIKANDLWNVSDVTFTGLQSQTSTFIPESKGKSVTAVQDKASAINNILTKKNDVFLMSASDIVSAHKKNPDETVVMWDAVEVSPIGMGIKKGNDELLKVVNEFIASMSDDGGVYDILRDKYNSVVEDLLGEGRNLDFYIEK